jgi:hypothetical protein
MPRITHLLRLAEAAALAMATSIPLFAPQTALTATWTVYDVSITELKPNIKPGGRANTIAVHPNFPLAPSTILVASESGGLFRSDEAF